MMEFHYQVGDEIKTVIVERQGDCFRVKLGDRVYECVATRLEHGHLDLAVNNQRLRAYVAHEGQRWWVALAGETWVLEQPQEAKNAGGQRGRRAKAREIGGAGGLLETTMPGHVLDVLVSEGDEVNRGDTLVLLEAMKMELRFTAPYAGRVHQIHCVAGQVVERGQLLLEIEPKRLDQELVL